MPNSKLLIGWKEWFSLPNLDIPAIKVKIDTGAKSSSIHAYDINYFKKSGKDYVGFELHPIENNNETKILCEAPLLDMRIIKSSSGDTEERPFIRTTIKINNIDWKIDLNLTNRDYMGSRMLLGREALASKLIIDPSQTHLHGNLSTKAVNKIYTPFTQDK